jgi:ABC-type uncharacterized transport system auxiliary subunit
VKAAGVALVALAAPLLSACVSIGLGGEVPTQAQYRLHDPGAATERRAAPLVAALLIQAQPADATADTLSIAYSTAPNRFAHYQLATWTERPVRQLPRLLRQRLEARGVAGAVGMVGDPLRADWWLAIGIETLHHDANSTPGQGRLAYTAELFDRRSRARIAQRRFEAAVPMPDASAAAAAGALSAATAQSFDLLVPWLEAELQRAAQRGPQ